MKITKIEIQKRNKDRVNVFVDEEYAFSLHAEIVYKNNIRIGQEITKDFIENISEVEEQKQANTYALNLISRAFKTEKQIRTKMNEKGFKESHIDSTVDMLKSYKYIDDTLYTKNYISDSVNFTKSGKNKIKTKLYQKGIDSETIKEMIDELVDDEQQFNAALEIGAKKYKTIRETDIRKKNQKLTSFLQYRGFSFDIIKKVLVTLSNEDYFLD